jgi:hypothetical protein
VRLEAELYDYCVAKGPLPEKLARVFMSQILTGPLLPHARVHVDTTTCHFSRVPLPCKRAQKYSLMGSSFGPAHSPIPSQAAQRPDSCTSPLAGDGAVRWAIRCGFLAQTRGIAQGPQA